MELPKIGQNRTAIGIAILVAVVAIVVVGAWKDNLAVISATVPLLTSALIVLLGKNDVEPPAKESDK